MFSQYGGRTVGTDLVVKGVANRFGLSLVRHNTADRIAVEYGRYGQGQSLVRNIVQGGEPSFPGLLFFARLVQGDQLDPFRVVKIGYGRVVKGNMAVFAYADAGKVYGVFS